jgi:hypothetical protein
MVYLLKKHSEKAEKFLKEGFNNIKWVKKVSTLHTFTTCLKICYSK